MYNVIKTQINCEGVKPCCVTAEYKTKLYTKFTCCCGHAKFFVSYYTKEQRKLQRRNRQRLCSTESDLSVTLKLECVIHLIQKTKETRDITLASDWLKETSVIVTRANVSRMFYH